MTLPQKCAREVMLYPAQGQIQNGKYQEPAPLKHAVVAVLLVSVRAQQIQAVARHEV